ncbi:MAG: hypothetical protein AMS14_10685 [Planctomycetes bacterium DG_20]|nr:MAG: hypothetical protein AMS14_10685 [Planctomycetes bacterium DG_20]
MACGDLRAVARTAEADRTASGKGGQGIDGGGGTGLDGEPGTVYSQRLQPETMIPEPATFVLAALGLAGYARRRRKRA